MQPPSPFLGNAKHSHNPFQGTRPVKNVHFGQSSVHPGATLKGVSRNLFAGGCAPAATHASSVLVEGQSISTLTEAYSPSSGPLAVVQAPGISGAVIVNDDVDVQAFSCMHYSAGELILTGTAQGVVNAYDVATNRQILSAPCGGAVNGIHILNGGLPLISTVESVSPEVSVGRAFLVTDLTALTCVPLMISKDKPFCDAKKVRAMHSYVCPEGIVWVATAGEEGHVLVFGFDQATSSFQCVRQFDGHLRSCMTVLFQGNYLWSGSKDCSIRIWDISTGACVAIINSKNNGHRGVVRCLRSVNIAGLDCVLSAGEDGSIKIWSRDGQLLLSQDDHPAPIATVEVMDIHDVPSLLVGLANGDIMIRSLATMEVRAVLPRAQFNTYIPQTITVFDSTRFTVMSQYPDAKSRRIVTKVVAYTLG
jgi:WD domain, G-beta repeat